MFKILKGCSNTTRAMMACAYLVLGAGTGRLCPPGLRHPSMHPFTNRVLVSLCTFLCCPNRAVPCIPLQVRPGVDPRDLVEAIRNRSAIFSRSSLS